MSTPGNRTRFSIVLKLFVEGIKPQRANWLQLVTPFNQYLLLDERLDGHLKHEKGSSYFERIDLELENWTKDIIVLKFITHSNTMVPQTAIRDLPKIESFHRGIEIDLQFTSSEVIFVNRN